MFFGAGKQKKITDTVLSQVQPLLNLLDRYLDRATVGLASDKYVLGFFCANIGVEMQRAGAGSLDQAARGTIMFSVLQRLFGRDEINAEEMINLMTGVPTPNKEFKRGIEAASKIQTVLSGHHNLQSDPDYIAAKETVRRAGGAYPGPSEDSKIGSEMMRVLYYQHVIALHQKQATDMTESMSAQEAQRIFNAYIAAMAAPGGVVRDLTTLPYPKERIKQALLSAIRRTPPGKDREALRDAYATLGHWQDTKVSDPMAAMLSESQQLLAELQTLGL